MTTTTIPQIKHQFLSGQIRILNAPLDPPDAWREAAPKPKTGNLNQKVIDDVLAKANRILHAHNANCFPPILLEHVCAQIDALYWSQTTTAAVLQGRHDGLDDSDAIPLDADLCDDTIIATLPSTLPDRDQNQVSSPGERSVTQRSALESDDLATRYTRARRELVGLAARREELERRKQGLESLMKLVEPLRSGEEDDGMDEELAAEMERMKELLASVGGRI